MQARALENPRDFAVASPITSSAQISGLERPRASSSRTARSRGVNADGCGSARGTVGSRGLSSTESLITLKLGA